MGNALEVAKKVATIPNVSTLTAQYVQTNDDGTVLVDFGQGSVQIYSAGFYTPLPGDFVRTLKVNGFTLMLGPVVPRPSYGRITATGSTLLTLLLPDSTTAQLPYVPGAFSSGPSVNQDVLINWANGGMIIGNVTQVPIPDYLPPVPSGGGSRSFMVDFRATDSGSYGSRWFTNDVWCSDSNIGAWFYGTLIADTIPDGAAVTSVQIYVNATQGYGSNPTVGTHAYGAKPGGPVGVSNAVAIGAGSGWMVLPNSFGDALKVGSQYGLGTNHGGYWIYSSRAADANSGLLRISWRT